MTDVPVRGYERRGRRVRPHRRGRPLRITVATRTSKAIPHADPRTDGEMTEMGWLGAYVEKDRPMVIRMNHMGGPDIDAEELVVPLLSHETLHAVIAKRVNNEASMDLDTRHGNIPLNDETGLRRRDQYLHPRKLLELPS